MLMEKYNDLCNSGILTSTNDLSIVGGMESLFQSIKRELEHYIGSHSYLDETYGSRLIEYTAYTPDIAQSLIRLETERIALKDERVKAVVVDTTRWTTEKTIQLHITTIEGLDYEYKLEVT